jgi:hypothetical protein
MTKRVIGQQKVKYFSKLFLYQTIYLVIAEKPIVFN